MAVTITAPQSAVVARGSVTLSWSPQYPQSAYEIMYRKKGDSAWSTFGQKSGSTTSVTMDLSKFVDFEEYHYRVVCYSNNATSGTTIYDGNDTSAAYSIIVVPANKVATMKTKYGSGMIEVPLYNDASMTDAISVKMGDGTVGRAPLRNADSALATNLKVHTAKGQKVALGNVPKFLVNSDYAYAYMRQDSRQLYTKYYYNSATYYAGSTFAGTYTRDSWYYYSGSTTNYTYAYNKTYYVGTIANTYGYRYNKTYYRGYYSKTDGYGYYKYSYSTSGTAYSGKVYQFGWWGIENSYHTDYYTFNHSPGVLYVPGFILATTVTYTYNGSCYINQYVTYYYYSVAGQSFAYNYGVVWLLNKGARMYRTYYSTNTAANSILMYNKEPGGAFNYFIPGYFPYNSTGYKYNKTYQKYTSAKYYGYYKYSYTATYKSYYGYYRYSYISSYTRYYGYYYYYYANYKYYYSWYYSGPFGSNYYTYTRTYLYK